MIWIIEYSRYVVCMHLCAYSFTGLLDKCQRNSFINDCLDLLLLCVGFEGGFLLWFCLHMFECYLGWSIVQFMFINSFIMCERVRVWKSVCFCCCSCSICFYQRNNRKKIIPYRVRLHVCVCESCAGKRPLEVKTYL